MDDSGIPQVFLLSPAFCGGRRAAILNREDSTLPLARAFREGTLTLGEAFSFLSGLYFRGKFTYARTFARGRRWAQPDSHRHAHPWTAAARNAVHAGHHA